MRSKFLIPFALAMSLSACAARPSPQLEAEVKQHGVILAAMAAYFNDLQERGVLPKPKSEPEQK